MSSQAEKDPLGADPAERATTKFKPRASARRSKEEREQIAEKERERRDERSESTKNQASLFQASARGSGSFGWGDRAGRGSVRGRGRGVMGQVTSDAPSATHGGAAVRGRSHGLGFRYGQGARGAFAGQEPAGRSLTAAERRRAIAENGEELESNDLEAAVPNPGVARGGAAEQASDGRGKQDHATSTSVTNEKPNVPEDANMNVNTIKTKVEEDTTMTFDQQDRIELDSDSDRYSNQINVEYIDLTDPSLENAINNSFYGQQSEKGSTPRIRPVFMRREPHIERDVLINTESSSATVTGVPKPKLKEESESLESAGERLGSTARKKRHRGRRSSTSKGDESSVRAETYNASGDTSIQQGLTDRHVRFDVPPDNEVDMEEDNDAMPSRSREKEAKEKKLRRRDARRKPLTREEELEHSIGERNLQTLQRELIQPPSSTAISGPTTHGEAPQGAQPTAQSTEKVYLFQFPPIMPDLKVKPCVPLVKTEESTGSFDDITTTGLTSNPQHKSSDINAPVNPASHANSAIKIDDDEPLPEETAPTPLEAALNPTVLSLGDPSRKFPAGHVGKLRVHKSGRTTLDWGGVVMDVDMGMQAEFLQTVAMLKMKTNDTDTGRDGIENAGESGEGPAPEFYNNGSHGEATCFGPVRGKFVVTPDWTSLLEP